ncbi:MAG: NERD domain-containing protein kinase family protein, partial [Polynucleobacter sp.]|nr:NERD domain-containing protein kinase family protein [Polynucleobacter sp.]
MARIILPKHGELPQNEGERRALAFLDAQLPPQPTQSGWAQLNQLGPEYILIPNLEIPDSASRFLEIDCIAVTPHAVYVIEVKDWGGRIDGDDTSWYLNDGRERKNPHKGLNYKCRVLKSMLERASAGLRHTWVQGIVLIAREETLLDLQGQCKAATFVLSRNLSEYLKDPSRIKAPRRINAQELAADQERISTALTGKARPRKDQALVIMGYQVEEVLAQEENLTEYLARSQRGSQSGKQQRLRVFSLPITLPESDRRALKNRMLRNYDALEAIGSHPNLVSLKGQYDLESDQMVEILDWSEEGTLRKVMTERAQAGKPFSWQETVKLVQGLAEGLQAAHGQGIIHRNLRPENILITPYGP